MPLLGKAIGGLIQKEMVRVISVVAEGSTATWTFTHVIAYYMGNPTGFDAGSDTQWFTPQNASKNNNRLIVQYNSSPLTRWKIETLPPGVIFVGGAELQVPQSGTISGPGP